MNIVIFGLAITSSWGNGHATTFRALIRALHTRGHRILFFEKNLDWYANNRDLPEPAFCTVRIFEDWKSIRAEVRRALRSCDVAMVGSYFPHGIEAINELLDSPAPVKSFYDIDTPITVAQLRTIGRTEYLTREQIPGFDLYFSFTGGPMLEELQSRFGAKEAVPLYCSFDPDQYRSWPLHRRYASDMSYMGTYASDRQAKIEELFCKPARRVPEASFLLAGPQYPRTLRWPANVRRIRHLNPHWHARFYSSCRLTLNVTRDEMVRAGYSPSVRLFEAAACGAAIASDYWSGLETFFNPNAEILLPQSANDVVTYLREMSSGELQLIGKRAQQRVLAEHTAENRAKQFEEYIQSSRKERRAAEPAFSGSAV